MENFQPGKLYRDSDMLPGMRNRVPQTEPFFGMPQVGRELQTPESPKGEHPGTLDLTPEQPEYWRERLKKLLKYTG